MIIYNSQKILDLLCHIVVEAGEITIKYFNKGNLNIEKKVDGTPFTEADLAVDLFIRSSLDKLFLNIPVITEESIAPQYEQRMKFNEYWLVDPIDGTQEFIKKNNGFSINIALIQKNVAVLGVIYFPILKTIYFGGVAIGAFKQVNKQPIKSIKTKKTDIKNVVAISSIDPVRSKNTNIYLNILKKLLNAIEIKKYPGSIKFCMLAEGNIDIVPKFEYIHEWDLAASQAIIEGAGGIVINKNQQRVLFNKNQSMLSPQFIAIADASIKQLFIEAIPILLRSEEYIKPNN